MYWATPATRATPAARGALKPVGSAPEWDEAEATAEEAEAWTLETTLETALGPREAAEDDALMTALVAPEVIEPITELMELWTDWDAEIEDIIEDWDEATDEAEAEASDCRELCTLIALLAAESEIH